MPSSHSFLQANAASGLLPSGAHSGDRRFGGVVPVGWGCGSFLRIGFGPRKTLRIRLQVLRFRDFPYDNNSSHFCFGFQKLFDFACNMQKSLEFCMRWVGYAQILTRARARKGEAQGVLTYQKITGIFDNPHRQQLDLVAWKAFRLSWHQTTLQERPWFLLPSVATWCQGLSELKKSEGYLYVILFWWRTLERQLYQS